MYVYVCVRVSFEILTVAMWCMGAGVAQGVGSGLFPTLHAPPSAPFGSSSLGNIGSPATTTSLPTGTTKTMFTNHVN